MIRLRRDWIAIYLACTLTLMAFGCSPPPKEVYVNVSAIIAAETPPIERPLQLPSPPAPLPGMSFTIPGKLKQVVQDASDPVTISVEQIQLEQAAEIHKLNRRLRALYASQVAHFAQQRLAEFETERTKAYDTANFAIQDLFAKYGDKRGPLLASLAVIVGWPDPDPESKNQPQAPGLVQKRFLLRAQQLRTDIAKLDADFSKEVDGRLTAAQQFSGKVLQQVEDDIEQFRTELNKRAEEEAAKQVRQTPKELDIRLAGTWKTVLPAIPAQSLTIPPGTALPPAPKVSSRGIGNGKEERRRLIGQELQIWLALNRFVLEDPRPGVPNVTEEFKAWRKTLLSDGPSAN